MESTVIVGFRIYILNKVQELNFKWWDYWCFKGCTLLDNVERIEDESKEV